MTKYYYSLHFLYLEQFLNQPEFHPSKSYLDNIRNMLAVRSLLCNCPSTRTHTCDMVLSASLSGRPDPTMQLPLYLWLLSHYQALPWLDLIRHLSHSRRLQQCRRLSMRLKMQNIFSVIKTLILNENLFQWQTDMFYNYMYFL